MLTNIMVKMSLKRNENQTIIIFPTVLLVSLFHLSADRTVPTALIFGTEVDLNGKLLFSFAFQGQRSRSKKWKNASMSHFYIKFSPYVFQSSDKCLHNFSQTSETLTNGVLTCWQQWRSFMERTTSGNTGMAGLTQSLRITRIEKVS